jgi:hypothetical protein
MSSTLRRPRVLSLSALFPSRSTRRSESDLVLFGVYGRVYGRSISGTHEASRFAQLRSAIWASCHLIPGGEPSIQ